MATELHDKLAFINDEKNKKILPENIKKGVKIFNVEGVADVLDTSDANATASDLLQGKSAYVQGTKIEGTIPSIETIEVTPQLDQESTQTYNAYVGNIRVPSILDVAGGDAEVKPVASVMAGGPRASSASATVNTSPGGMLVACIKYRGTREISGEGWTTVAINEMTTAENYYQCVEVLVKPTTGTSETVSVNTPNLSERIAIYLISYDTLCPLELISEYTSGPKRVSQSTTIPGVRKGDILIAHNFWTSSGCYIGGVNLEHYRRCSDGGRLAVGLAANDSNSVYFYNDSTSELGGLVIRINSELSSNDIRVGRKILGITGTYTSDADAEASHIMTGKTAYVNGVKLSGTIATLGDEVQVSATKAQVNDDNDKFVISSVTPSAGVIQKGATYQITANGNQVMGALGLAPDMLRSGINILGIEGTYGADASEFAAKYETSGRTTNLTPLTMITSIQFVNMEGVTDASRTFESLTYLKSLPEMNLDSATSMTNFCQFDTNIIYMPNLSIPKVTSIAYAFRNCHNISKINLTNSNSLTTLTNAFDNCISLTTMPDMNYNSAYALTGAFCNSGITGNIDMSGFTKSGSTMTLNYMFYNCPNITGMHGFNKQGTAQLNCYGMFQNCTNLRSIENCNFFNMNWGGYMFSNCINLVSVNNTGFSYVQPCVYSEIHDKSYMFYNCNNLVTLDNNFWMNFQARGMNYTFANCEKLEFPDYIFINMVGNNSYYGTLTNTFQNCRKLKSIEYFFSTYYYASSYNYSPYFNKTFDGCTNLHTVIINNLQYNNVGGLLSGQPFTNCPNLTNIQFVNFKYLNSSYKRPQWAGVAAGSGITSINNITGINLFETYSGIQMFANCHKLYDLGEEYLNFFNMTTSAYMFANCYNLKQLNYNQININKVQNVQGMFEGCNGMSVFNDWTFNTVTMINYMFNSASFDKIENLSFPLTTYAGWTFKDAKVGTINNIILNNPNAANIMDGLKANVVSNIIMSNATQGNAVFMNSTINELKDIDMGKMINGQYMFYNAKIENISNVNISSMQNAYQMCGQARSLNLIKSLDFTKVTNAYSLFSNIHVTSLNNLNLTIGNGTSYYLFSSSADLTEIDGLNLYMNNFYTAHMFSNCQNLTTVRNFTMSNIGNMYMGFNGCVNLTTVENINMPFVNQGYYMFANCANLRTIVNIDMPSVTYAGYMFYNCPNLVIAPSINTINLRSMEYMFQACNNLTDIPALQCDNIANTYTMFGQLPNLTNFGGWINLGKGYENYSTNNTYTNMFLNWFPNLTQESIYNIIDNLYPTKNYQRFYMLTSQYQMLDSTYRTKLQNEKRRYILTVSK